MSFAGELIRVAEQIEFEKWNPDTVSFLSEMMYNAIQIDTAMGNEPEIWNYSFLGKLIRYHQHVRTVEALAGPSYSGKDF